MKWLVACALVLAPVLAAARAPMPRLPVLARTCSSAATYGALESCLNKLGDVTIVRDLTHARLLRVSRDGADLGVGLYVQDGSGWHIGGTYEPGGQPYEVLALSPLTVGQHAGFRLDVGVVQRAWVSIDSVRAVPAVVVARRALLCDGTRWRCVEVIVACDTLVRGAALWTFRGTLSIADNQVHVAGDRSHSGQQCTVPQDAFLGWTQP